jgi:hypothetical protein
MPVAAWIAIGACVFGVVCAVLLLVRQLAAGRARAEAAAQSSKAALEISEKVIDAQNRPDPSDPELDRFLRQRRDRG